MNVIHFEKVNNSTKQKCYVYKWEHTGNIGTLPSPRLYGLFERSESKRAIFSRFNPRNLLFLEK